TLLGRKRMWVLALLIVPAARFGPRYFALAAGASQEWADTAMDRDSRQAARLVAALARPGDTLVAWGFRPELYTYTGLPAASRFLESQPLTGVAADRHLVESRPSLPAGWIASNRRELVRSRPTFIVDGLGPYNRELAITAYPDLGDWLAGYREAARSPGSIVYRRR
ncbi:MAG: hypothetical protein HY013_00870, partial [Candidatus Solibacter usitatus]|nr:hypothetical protein [Candidatus Solibacter usitatus]